MAAVSLELLGSPMRRLDSRLDRVIAGIAGLKADMEVSAALVRRLDSSVQGLTGEVRALHGQQDRQRQRFDRLDAGLEALEQPSAEPPARNLTVDEAIAGLLSISMMGRWMRAAARHGSPVLPFSL
jgi:hypothetical protein